MPSKSSLATYRDPNTGEVKNLPVRVWDDGSLEVIEKFYIQGAEATGGGGGIDSVNTVTGSTGVTLDSDSAVVQNISMTESGHVVNLPDATTVDVGLRHILFNSGSNNYGIFDASGAYKDTVSGDTVFYCYLVDNSTAAGTWIFDPAVVNYPVFGSAFEIYSNVGTEHSYPVNLDDTVALAMHWDKDNSVTKVRAVSLTDKSLLGTITISSDEPYYGITGSRLSDTQAMFVFQNDASRTLNAVVIEYSGGTLSIVGSETVIDSNDPRDYFDSTVLDNSHVMAVYRESLNADLRASVVNFDGATISVAAGPTQIDANDQQYMACDALDSTNVIAVAQDGTSDDPYAYSINWDGATTISLNDTKYQIATMAMSGYPTLVKLVDTGSYAFYFVITRNLDNTNNEGRLDHLRITRSTNSVFNTETISVATDKGYDPYRDPAFVLPNTVNTNTVRVFIPYLYYNGINDIIRVAIYDYTEFGNIAKVGEYDTTVLRVEQISAVKLPDSGVLFGYDETNAGEYGVLQKLSVIA